MTKARLREYHVWQTWQEAGFTQALYQSSLNYWQPGIVEFNKCVQNETAVRCSQERHETGKFQSACLAAECAELPLILWLSTFGSYTTRVGGNGGTWQAELPFSLSISTRPSRRQRVSPLCYIDSQILPLRKWMLPQIKPSFLDHLTRGEKYLPSYLYTGEKVHCSLLPFIKI